MALFSLSHTVPPAIGPWAAGLIVDNLNPDLVWYFSGLLSAAAVAGFVGLHFSLGDRVARSTSPTTAGARVSPSPTAD